MTPAQAEALHIARYALTRVVDVHIMPAGDRLARSLSDAVAKALDEIEEALPVGDLGEKPIKLILATLREAKSRALEVNGYSAADKIDEVQSLIVLADMDGRT